jgi:hypothetical protein
MGQSGDMSQGSSGSQSDTSLADRTGQQGGQSSDVGPEGSQGGGSGSGFVGSQGSDSSEYLQEGQQRSSDQNFAEQGRGAPDDEEGTDGSSDRSS